MTLEYAGRNTSSRNTVILVSLHTIHLWSMVSLHITRKKKKENIDYFISTYKGKCYWDTKRRVLFVNTKVNKRSQRSFLN